MADLDVNAALLVSPGTIAVHDIRVRVNQRRQVGAETLEDILGERAERQLSQQRANRQADSGQARLAAGHRIQHLLNLDVEHAGDLRDHRLTRA